MLRQGFAHQVGLFFPSPRRLLYVSDEKCNRPRRSFSHRWCFVYIACPDTAFESTTRCARGLGHAASVRALAETIKSSKLHRLSEANGCTLAAMQRSLIADGC